MRPGELKRMAGWGCWYFELERIDERGDRVFDFLAKSGLNGLNQILDRMHTPMVHPKWGLIVESGGSVPITEADVLELRAEYVKLYGLALDKPNEYPPVLHPVCHG